jgi:hypothetical protein
MGRSRAASQSFDRQCTGERVTRGHVRIAHAFAILARWPPPAFLPRDALRRGGRSRRGNHSYGTEFSIHRSSRKTA